MATLFHQPICPFSRKIRLILAEKKFAVEYVEERPWERRLDFLMLNPSGEVPVLVGDAGLYRPLCHLGMAKKGGATPLYRQRLGARWRAPPPGLTINFTQSAASLKNDRRLWAEDGGVAPIWRQCASARTISTCLEYMTYLLQPVIGWPERFEPGRLPPRRIFRLDYTAMCRGNYEARFLCTLPRPSFVRYWPRAGMRPPPYYADLDF